MDIKHLIINLPGSNREGFVSNQLTQLGFQYELVNAIKGEELKLSNEFLSVPANYTLDSEKRSWNHFACHLSWIKALQYAKKNNNQYFVIYEDDCLLIPSYKESLEILLQELPADWVFINLGVRELYNLNLLPSKHLLAETRRTVTGMQSVLFNGNQVDQVLYQLLSWKNWVEILSPRITFPKFATYPALTSQSAALPTNIRN